METFQIYSEPLKLYRSMLNDIKNAKKSIYLETYIYDNDEIGKKFRDALIKKASEGIKVRLLLDAWGSSVDKHFFKKLIKKGGRVRFFKEFRYVIRMFSKNHERNHRKLLIVDRKIAHIGSANITQSCLKWRELSARLEGDIAGHFAVSFARSWNLYGKITKKKIKRIIHKGFEIIQDIPSDEEQLTKSKYIELIKNAKKDIFIETPYFVPSNSIRNALANAVKRKVNVHIIIPYVSDVQILDLMRNRYLGSLYKKGVHIHHYIPPTLHSKLLIVDNNFFMLGSSNLDYRSFIHQYEINLLGKDKDMIFALRKHFFETLSKSRPFSYEEWRSRSSLGKIVEMIVNLGHEYF